MCAGVLLLPLGIIIKLVMVSCIFKNCLNDELVRGQSGYCYRMCENDLTHMPILSKANVSGQHVMDCM